MYYSTFIGFTESEYVGFVALLYELIIDGQEDLATLLLDDVVCSTRRDGYLDGYDTAKQDSYYLSKDDE